MEQQEGIARIVDGRHFHDYCWNAVRSGRRLLKSPDAAQALATLMVQDPAKYRKVMMPLVAKPGTSRTRQHRQVYAELVTEMCSYKAVQRLGRRLLLSKKRYVAFYKFGEGMDSDAASEAWDDDLRSGVYHEKDRHGNLLMAVEGNTEIQDISGRSEKKLTKERHTVDPENARRGQRLQTSNEAVGGAIPEFLAKKL